MKAMSLEEALIDRVARVTPHHHGDHRRLRDRLWKAIRASGWQPSPAPQHKTDDVRRSDEALLVAFAEGDPAAFDELLRRFSPKLVAFGCKYLSHTESEELAQEAFMVLLRRAPKPEGIPKVAAFLFKTMRLLIRNAHRRHVTEAATQDLLVAEVVEAAAVTALEDRLIAHADRPRMRERLVAALDEACNPLEQDVVLLVLEEQDIESIAASLEITSGHARVLKHRALSKLRATLGDLVEP
jgi:RNA polymerase sigma-70 factor, ECF subfamily